MANSASMGNMLNYFNNLLNNQALQQQFNQFITQTQQANIPAQQKNTTTQNQTTQAQAQLGNALNSLSGLINSSNKASAGQISLISASVSYTVDRLISQGADPVKIQNLVNMVSSTNNDDLLYTRTPSKDTYINLQNRNPVTGADLNSLLSQASQVVQRGDDINKYLDVATNIVNKGDYDDLRRFISVTDTVMRTGQSLNKYYDFANNVLDKRHYDLESNIFSVQTLLTYGTNLDTALKVLGNMENTGLAGRNNMVDLHRVIIDARNKGAYVPYILDQMAKSGDTRSFMDGYMKSNGMKTTAPDFNKYKRIERIDGEDMVIKQGESAALFSQAISQAEGLLPESVLYWSSVQTGALSHGSSYLDLSKLGPGTYDIYVKIGNYAGGTDTAKKRVIVLPKDGNTDDCHDDKETKTKGNNGLGDQKDGDNTTKGTDTSNPGHNKTITQNNSVSSKPIHPVPPAPPLPPAPPTRPVLSTVSKNDIKKVIAPTIASIPVLQPEKKKEDEDNKKTGGAKVASKLVAPTTTTSSSTKTDNKTTAPVSRIPLMQTINNANKNTKVEPDKK